MKAVSVLSLYLIAGTPPYLHDFTAKRDREDAGKGSGVWGSESKPGMVTEMVSELKLRRGCHSTVITMGMGEAQMKKCRNPVCWWASGQG